MSPLTVALTAACSAAPFLTVRSSVTTKLFQSLAASTTMKHPLDDVKETLKAAPATLALTCAMPHKPLTVRREPWTRYVLVMTMTVRVLEASVRGVL
eukprot:765647-Hanusia_phi.AAC.1